MALALKQPEIQEIISSKIQYQVQKAHLLALMKQSKPSDAKNVKAEIEETLKLAKSLSRLYKSLNEKLYFNAVENDIIKLQKALYLPLNRRPFDTSSLPSCAQEITFHFDTTRLITGNVRRIMMALSRLPSLPTARILFAGFIDATGPVLTLLGFLVYLPRTLLNGIVLIKRGLENQDVPASERMLVHAEMDNRLFNILNDFPTVLGGFIAVFILTSPTLYLAAYVTVAVKFCEVIAALIKAELETTRLHNIKQDYIELYKKEGCNKKHLLFMETLSKTIEAETHELYSTCAMHALLLIALFTFIPPIIAISPYIPLTSAILAIGFLGLRIPEFRHLFFKTAPESDLSALEKYSFFAAGKDRGSETEPELNLLLIKPSLSP